MFRGFQGDVKQFTGAGYRVLFTPRCTSSQVRVGDWSVKQAFGLLIAHSKPFLALPAVLTTPKPASQSAWGLQITL
ncbi:hypothetical protein PSEUDO9AZ_10898 [Pseudomonas sp. 9AZ]|nr:hypothetical protein PSEUDO9AZ_10898 [Pseudomonas sp. 9AZ]